MNRIESSFRDPSGYVFQDGDKIFRSINAVFSEDWNHGVDSGFISNSMRAGKLISFRECESLPGSWKSLSVEKLPFISYPYEWCFSQLRDAAILTLELQASAIEKGLSMKDASAFNVQFEGVRPIFIDLLSFAIHRAGEPWSAYRQFCMHFLAPLAITAESDIYFGVLSKLWIDGVPLRLAARILPWTSRLRFGLLWHIFLHARMEARHGDARKSGDKARSVKVSTSTLKGIVDSLASTVKGLRAPAAKTEWGDYYNDTNYTPEAAEFKLNMVEKVAMSNRGGRLAIDLGANTGRFSVVMAEYFSTVIAADMDPMAVERLYLGLHNAGPKNILPLVVDLANSSPSLGWACRERESFSARCQADFLSALALVHHLVLSAGIPLSMIAAHFAQLLRVGGILLLEFVPKDDSQVKRLLAARKDVFDDYNLEAMHNAFAAYFECIESMNIPDSTRTLHLMKRL